MSCLETAESAGGAAGVALEIELRVEDAGETASGPAARTMELRLARGGVVSLQTRKIIDRSGRTRALLATLPAAAFTRVAGDARVAIAIGGRVRELSATELDSLRRIAAYLAGTRLPMRTDRTLAGR